MGATGITSVTALWGIVGVLIVPEINCRKQKWDIQYLTALKVRHTTPYTTHHRHFNTVIHLVARRPQSKCEKERDAANSLELVGNFIPQCEEDGSYSQSQCYGSTGYCWCVSTQGKKLIGTEVRFNRPNCSEGKISLIRNSTTPNHTISHNTLPYHTIQYHTIPYNTIPYHTIPYHTIPCFLSPVTCENVTCSGQAERCELDENDRPRCVCPMECPAILDRVCGSDGETYNNECHMNAVACSEERRINVTYRGACQPPPPNSKYTTLWTATQDTVVPYHSTHHTTPHILIKLFIL